MRLDQQPIPIQIMFLLVWGLPILVGWSLWWLVKRIKPQYALLSFYICSAIAMAVCCWHCPDTLLPLWLFYFMAGCVCAAMVIDLIETLSEKENK